MKKLFWILLSAAVLCACDDDDTQKSPQPQATVEIGVGTLGFLPGGDPVDGTNVVRVTSSGAWRLTGRKTWCTPSAVEGKSGDAVTFTADANPSSEPRSEVFTFICGGSTARLLVTQANDKIVECSEDRFDLDSEGGLIRLRMESNVEGFTAEIDPVATEWITPFTGASETRAMQTFYKYYRVAANDTYYPRSGSIVLSGEGLEPRSLPVHQAQTDMLRVDGETEYKGELTAGQMRVTVWSNIPFEVVIPEKDRSWLHLEAPVEEPREWSSQELVFNLDAADEFRTSLVELRTGIDELNQALFFQQGEAKLLQFPDDVFREYLLGLGYIMASGDGYLLTSEGAAATALDTYTTLWSKGGIASAEGIEAFTNLTTLNCGYGRLRALDISTTKVADLSKCVPNALETLHVGPNVTTVNFGSSSAWSDGKLYDYTTKSGSYPYSYYWSQSLVLSGENITTVNLWRNKLTTLDVSGCPNLQTLDCRMQNYELMTLTMSASQMGKVTVTKDSTTQIVYK